MTVQSPTTTFSTAKDRDIPIGELVESTTNPRAMPTGPAKQAFKELVASVESHGILSPLLVRPITGDLFEIVFGHRRFRAAKEAGLDVVPCRVREMNDEAVLEAQIVENCQREDMHPLDEADAYHRLRDTFGHGVDDVASRVSKSKPYVYARMKLRELSEPCQKAFRSGELSISVAGFLARMPNPKHQTAVLEWIRQQVSALRNPTAAEIGAFIAREYHLDLDAAPFDTENAGLVPDAGACSACPKRAGNQKTLYPDIEKGDTCTDSLCFKAKGEAAWKALTAEAEAEGRRVLSASAAKKLFPYGVQVGNGWLDLADKAQADPKKRTWRRILGNDGWTASALCRDPHGHPRQVIEEAKAFEIAIERGEAWAKKEMKSGRVHEPEDSDDSKAEREKLTAKRNADRELAEELCRRIVSAARDQGPTELVLRFCAAEFAAGNSNDAERVLEAQGVPLDAKQDPSQQLEKLIAKMNLHGLSATLVDLLVGIYPTAFNGLENLKPIAKDFGIDPKEVAKEMKAAKEAPDMSAEAVDPDEIDNGRGPLDPKKRKERAAKAVAK